MAHRSYRTAAPATNGDGPARGPTFDLGGIGVLTGVEWVERFACVPVCPSGVLDDLVASVSTDKTGETTFNTPSLLTFFDGVLLDEDAARFRRLTHDKDRAVDVDTLGRIMLDLAEELAGRPTMRPSTSGDGPPRTEATSAAG